MKSNENQPGTMKTMKTHLEPLIHYANGVCVSHFAILKFFPNCVIAQQIASSNELYHVGCVWQTKSFTIPRITNDRPDTVHARASVSVRVCVVSTDSVYM